MHLTRPDKKSDIMYLLRSGTLHAVLLFVTLFFSCSDVGETGGERITLTYWSAANQYEIDLAAAIVDEWNGRHPEIEVKHQPIPEGSSSEEIVLASVVGKTTPDVFSNMWPGDIELYAQADALVPLDHFVDYDSFAASRYSPGILQESLANDGRCYHILWKTNPIMMAYNKKWLSRAGFDHPPETYEEFLNMGETITADTDGDGYTDRWMGITQILVTWWQRFFDYYTLYIAASGGKTLVENGVIDFDNNTSVAVFRFLQTVFSRGYFPRERMDARSDAFLHSIVATRFVGPWEVVHAEKFKPEGFEYDFAPVPRPEGCSGPVYTYGDYKSIVLFKNSRHPEEAWRFAKHLVSRANDLKLLEMTNQLPLRKGLTQDTLFIPYFERNPMMERFARQAQYCRGTDYSPVLKEIFDAISQEFEASVIYGLKPPEEAVRRAAERARLISDQL